MKFNLKNRPRAGVFAYTNTEKLTEWFEKFEQELRQWRIQCLYDGVVKYAPVFILIEEILGE